MINVPDHVYVLGLTYTCHTLKNITDKRNNNTCDKPSFAFELNQFQKMWKLAVALETYVLFYIVYCILPSFVFQVILFL
jgi:hypothetical protein